MMNRLLCLLLVCTLARAETSQIPGAEEVTFELEGARCAVVVPPPASRNKRVLIYCHGYRPDKAPLDPELLPLKRTYVDYLRDGWILASTSYRRNGVIVADAMKDVRALRDEIVKRYGEPWVVLLHGESMGGAVATLLVEAEPEKFSGALAVGAALGVDEGGKKIALKNQLKAPMVFLNNRSELEPAAAYAKGISGDFRPLTRTVDRDGHVNVNQRELGRALGLLSYWVSTKTRPKEDQGDLTSPPFPRPSAMKKGAAGSGEAAMVQRNPIYGNVTLDFQGSDLTELGLKPGDTFRLTKGGKTVSVKYGRTYSDVSKGEWVAFLDGEDRLLVALHSANAAEALGIKVGDLATVATR